MDPIFTATELAEQTKTLSDRVVQLERTASALREENQAWEKLVLSMDVDEITRVRTRGEIGEELRNHRDYFVGGSVSEFVDRLANAIERGVYG